MPSSSSSVTVSPGGAGLGGMGGGGGGGIPSSMTFSVSSRAVISSATSGFLSSLAIGSIGIGL